MVPAWLLSGVFSTVSFSQDGSALQRKERCVAQFRHQDRVMRENRVKDGEE